MTFHMDKWVLAEAAKGVLAAAAEAWGELPAPMVSSLEILRKAVRDNDDSSGCYAAEVRRVAIEAAEAILGGATLVDALRSAASESRWSTEGELAALVLMESDCGSVALGRPDGVFPLARFAAAALAEDARRILEAASGDQAGKTTVTGIRRALKAVSGYGKEARDDEGGSGAGEGDP
jgi:hypothetical protein